MTETIDQRALEGDLTPEFLNRSQEELFAYVSLRHEAIVFLNSDLGRVLRGMAIQRKEHAKEEFLKTPLWRKRKLAKLQWEAAVADQFLVFIQEVLQSGEAAEEAIIQMDAEASDIQREGL